jgi:hypothetical protein
MSAKRSGAVIRNIIVGYCDNATIKNIHHKDSLSLEFYKCFDWIDGRFFFYVGTTPITLVSSRNITRNLRRERVPANEADQIRYLQDRA